MPINQKKMINLLFHPLSQNSIRLKENNICKNGSRKTILNKHLNNKIGINKKLTYLKKIPKVS